MTTLVEWIEANPIDENLKYRQAAHHQYGVARELHRLVVPIYADRKENDLSVISSHTSKSVTLPVYSISTKDIALTMRDNFHNWKISVMALHRVPDLFHSLIDRNAVIPAIYCEGFPEFYVFGCYEDDQTRFTVELPSDYTAWAFVYLLAVGLGIRR